MKDQIILRKGQPQDIDQIISLIAKNPDTLLPRTAADYQELIKFTWVGEVEDRIVGSATLEVYSSKIAEIRSVAVDNDFRHSGIGTELVMKCVEDAKKQHIHEIMVVTSIPKFFEKMNFKSSLNEKYALFWNEES